LLWLPLPTSASLSDPQVKPIRHSPPPKPVLNFEKILAHKPDDDWLPAILAGEILPFTRRQITLNPRGVFTTTGICHAWNTFPGKRMDATYLTMITDCIPSMSDTLLQDKGPYDAHTFLKPWKHGWRSTSPSDKFTEQRCDYIKYDTDPWIYISRGDHLGGERNGRSQEQRRR
jgi:hypothetical protein